ncbi:aldose 1-epimerase family protein [Sphingomonas sp.]|uniref:aldose 1-epimerase family protein n=1 Tax=Sphingomonas sp. TaxID=28214 RepID=UPI003B3A0588
MGETVRIENGLIAAEVDPLGAELVRLQDEQGRDLLWDGDPAFWTGHAPILFPIVGALAGGVLRLDDEEYPLPRHGFARRRAFTLVERDAARVTFRLEADAESRAVYPFDFRLDIGFLLMRTTLTCEALLHNPGAAPLPASVGFHPAFRWPLPWGGARESHRLRFEKNEPAPIRRVDGDGLLRPEHLPSPIVGQDLPLADALFEDDALILDRPESRLVSYGVPGGRQMRIGFAGMPMLGIWSKPGAGFVCVEPWQGIADPVGFAGDFPAKPGVVEIAPGATRSFAFRVDIGADGH